LNKRQKAFATNKNARTHTNHRITRVLWPRKIVGKPTGTTVRISERGTTRPPEEQKKKNKGGT